MAVASSRPVLVRRAILLESAIIAYNLAEGCISIVAGLIAGSVVLVGFGLDSAIEVSAAVVVLVHLTRSRDDVQPEWERRVAVFVGLTLLLLAAYVTGRAAFSLAVGAEPAESWVGIGITGASLIVMPIVSRMQRRYAERINSLSLAADAKETLVCTYLSGIALGGLALNALVGWWWADPVASLVMVVFIVREGWEIFRTRVLVCID
jgi:divalent metal cation (Fe/Co/Zn/Cd) transporter